jgi:hypothetical protein
MGHWQVYFKHGHWQDYVAVGYGQENLRIRKKAGISFKGFVTFPLLLLSSVAVTREHFSTNRDHGVVELRGSNDFWTINPIYAIKLIIDMD